MRHNAGRNLLAGLTVAVVALPLALGFGITSGMGAAAGLVTAIVAGVLAALFGGSNVQVSGPTGAMTVVLVPIIAEHGASGVLVVGMMAGLLLVAMSWLRLGQYVRLIPLPVIEGFTIGIACIIAIQQLPAALGASTDEEHILAAAVDAFSQWLHTPTWAPLLLTVATVGLILALSRRRPQMPGALIAVVVTTVVVAVSSITVTVIGPLPSQIPAPTLPSISLDQLSTLWIPAIAVAALAALESLLSATVADAMTVGERHDPNRELFGQGIANIATPLFGGIPATAAIARTAVNVRNGATTRLAAVSHSLILLLVVVSLSQIVALIPLAALAGVLIATAIRMIEVSSVRALLHSTRRDALVLLITFAATLILDLATAVILGVLIAGILALRQAARSVDLAPIPVHAHTPDDSTARQHLLDDQIVAYRIDGPLFFLGAHDTLQVLAEQSQVQVVILRLSHLTALDVTGAAILTDTVHGLEARNIPVLITGLPPRFQPVLESRGLIQHLNQSGRVFPNTPAAISHARNLVAKDTGNGARIGDV